MEKSAFGVMRNRFLIDFVYEFVLMYVFFWICWSMNSLILALWMTRFYMFVKSVGNIQSHHFKNEQKKHKCLCDVHLKLISLRWEKIAWFSWKKHQYEDECEVKIIFFIRLNHTFPQSTRLLNINYGSNWGRIAH